GMVVTLLVVMGGRVIPFFIERGLQGVTIRKWEWIERLALVSILAYVLVETLLPESTGAMVLAFAAALVNGIRVAGWYHRKIWSVSLLWVLYLGYSWVAVGLLMQGLSIAGWVSPMLSLHALTVGGVGVLTLGMMARVAIGHTGRPMQAHSLMGWAFALVVMSAVVRVMVPLLFPTRYALWIDIAGGLWLLAFVPFFIIYYPILTRPRVDGQPG
ncbi:MAG: NnrS family protein, partial [Desulfosarcina sp.]